MSDPREMKKQVIALGAAHAMHCGRATDMHDWLLAQTAHGQSAGARILLLPTAGCDNKETCLGFERTCRELGAQPSVLRLWAETYPARQMRELVANQDLIYVSGGNTAQMLRIWRQRGLDALLHEAYAGGVTLCGTSAGGMCWFEGGLTDSYGDGLEALRDQPLGFIRASFTPHFQASDGPRNRRLVEDVIAGELPAGYALPDDTSLRFVDGVLTDVVVTCDPPREKTYFVECDAAGKIAARVLPPTLEIDEWAEEQRRERSDWTR